MILRVVLLLSLSSLRRAESKVAKQEPTAVRSKLCDPRQFFAPVDDDDRAYWQCVVKQYVLFYNSASFFCLLYDSEPQYEFNSLLNFVDIQAVYRNMISVLLN